MKILESGPDKLVSRAQQAVDEMEEKNEEELKDIAEKIQFNKSYIQRMARILLASKDSEVADRTHEIMHEAKLRQPESTRKI